ncbi:hypothetical protein HK100_007472 [Physocladia obscura]|uniref:Uncharacterized protein n=1 Tax=Physocladia obscura TaxID=109957 RepID=A0AAD5XAS6_9FUNG|nr:hypothetical protein HK100_007472 [Physocladia obscura]
MSTLFKRSSFKTQRNLVDKLRSINLGNYVELPQIAVMGDTSSGKSSVLSAISGITFPSSSELTKRCPTQVILSESENFSGTVRLVRFKPVQKETQKPKILSSPDEIEHEIERLTKQLISEKQSISDDAIVIEVSGPSYPNLTLTDLPGLIRTVEDDEDPAIIVRVRSLVNRYLIQSRTVILAIVPANVDVHNTEILQAAAEADSNGERTISIITKPDLIDTGVEAQVLDLLMNRKKALKLGYHAVKCRGQQELKNRQVDPEFLGINRLTAKLVKTLDSIIGSSLPAVVKEINQRLTECELALKPLGVAIDSTAMRRMYFYDYMDSVRNIMNDALTGAYEHKFFAEGEDDNRVRALLRKSEISFREIIAKTDCVENFRIIPPSVGNLVDVKSTSVWIPKTVIYGPNAIGEIIYTGVNSWVAESATTWRKIQVLDLTSLKTEIQENRSDDLAIFPSYKLFCNLLLDEVESIVSSRCDRILDLTSSLRFPKIKGFTQLIMSDIIKAATLNTLNIIQYALKSEYRPYTLNHYLFDVLVKLRTEPLLESLESLSTDSSRNVNLDAVLTVLKNHGVGNVSNEDRKAMELQWAIKAYLKVAKKRFIDTVPMLIQQNFMEIVLQKLIPCLSAVDDHQLELILEETISSINNREKLAAELLALNESKKEISSINFA